MKQLFQKFITENSDFVIDIYRHLHANPELSFQEYNTAAYIQQKLSEMNFSFRAGIGGNGILAKIEGKNPTKKVIALRADMDALPVNETNNLPWKSRNNGVMHACGHDAHTACLLGAAKILKNLQEDFEGTVLLIFQPGEEKAPGGARLMLEDGIFNDIEPELILAQHISVDYPTGTVGFRESTIMASADEIHVKISGKGGHGALPHLCNDTVLAAAQTLVSLQQVKSRLCSPFTPMVLTFGRLIADGAQNIIPHEVQLSGTFRTMDENWRKTALTKITQIITETCEAYGCKAQIDIPDGYPCVINNPDITFKARSFAAEYFGIENIKELDVRMTSEDFSFFAQRYPSCFYRFGAKSEKNDHTGGLHSSNFIIDEDALLTGTAGMAWLAYRFLSE